MDRKTGHNTETKAITDPWNGHQETLVAKWAKDAQLYAGLHSEASKVYYFWGRVLGIPVIFFTALGGTTEMATINSDPEQWLKIVKGLVLLVLCGLTLISQYLDLGGLSAKHKHSAVAYEDLSRTVEEELVEDRGQRKPARAFMDIVRKQLGALRKACPVISDRVIDKYINQLEILGSPVAINSDTDSTAVPSIRLMVHRRSLNPLNTPEEEDDSDPVISKTRGMLDRKSLNVV